MRRPIEILVDIGSLAYGSSTKVDVVYEIEIFPGNSGDQPRIREIEVEMHPIDKRDDLAGLVGKELILILQDGRKLPLSLADAKGHFKAKGPIESV